MAVGNIIGSNLFNILCVLGVTAMVAPGGLPVSPEALYYHIPISLVVAVICVPIFFTDMKVSRWQAFMMLFLYVLYLTFTILSSSGSAHVELFQSIRFVRRGSRCHCAIDWCHSGWSENR